MRGTLIAIAVAVSCIACGGEASRASGAEDPPSTNDDTTLTVETPVAFKGEQRSGVWLFWHDYDDSDLALLRGTPAVVNGCLTIGEYVVIWHRDRLAEVRDLVATMASGNAPAEIDVGGSESVAPRSEIAERCPSLRVWFGGP